MVKSIASSKINKGTLTYISFMVLQYLPIGTIRINYNVFMIEYWFYNLFVYGMLKYEVNRYDYRVKFLTLLLLYNIY